MTDCVLQSGKTFSTVSFLGLHLSLCHIVYHFPLIPSGHWYFSFLLQCTMVASFILQRSCNPHCQSIVLHCIVMVYQLISLNVAVNSYDNALLSLLISNQFVEIKGSVFKKFEKDGLFQITCAGVSRGLFARCMNSFCFRYCRTVHANPYARYRRLSKSHRTQWIRVRF